MTCPHDLAERETACADGMCPLCLAADIGRLQIHSSVLMREIERLRARADAGYALLKAIDGGMNCDVAILNMRSHEPQRGAAGP